MDKNIKKLTPRIAIDKLRTAMGQLNDTQKSDVRAMGFGNVLEINVTKLPLALASALFHYYDPESSSIQIISTKLKITKETDLTITKESVHSVFGFPMGMFQVELPEKTSKHVPTDDPVTCQWQEQFNGNVEQYHKITVDMVLNKMASQSNGGLEFKQNFLVSVLTILGTGPQTGYVDQDCLHKLNVDRISEMDWCTYILNALNKRRKERKPTNSSKQNFVFPLLLLVFFYVHSTRDKSDATYTLPPIIYLTKELLSDRKKDHLFFDRKEDRNDINSEQVKNLDDGETKSEEAYIQDIKALVTEAYTNHPNSKKLKMLHTAVVEGHDRPQPSLSDPSSPHTKHTPLSNTFFASTSLFQSTPKSSPRSSKSVDKLRELLNEVATQMQLKRPRARPYSKYDYFQMPEPEDVNKVASAVFDPSNKLGSLAPGKELNTQVVPEYFKWLVVRNKKEPDSFLKCYFFHPFFYTKLVNNKDGYNYESVKSWTTKCNLSQYKKIFVPVLKEIGGGRHWCLGVINILDKEFQYFDSNGCEGDQVLENLAKYFKDEMNDKNGGWDFTLWKKKNMENLPQQENDYDCGMFMLMYADFCCRPRTNINFDQRHMPLFRIKAALYILNMNDDSGIKDSHQIHTRSRQDRGM